MSLSTGMLSKTLHKTVNYLIGQAKGKGGNTDNDNCKKSQKPVTSSKNVAKIPSSTPLDLFPCQPACLLKQVVGEQI